MTYNPTTTTFAAACAMCGLTSHPWPAPSPSGSDFMRCVLRDSAGAEVFRGERWPDAWLYMANAHGLTQAGGTPDGWYSSSIAHVCAEVAL